MESALKVATPFTAATLPPPVRVPSPGFVPIASDTPLVAVVTRLLNWSRISTWTAGVIATPAVTLLGCTTKFRLLAAAGFTTTLAVWVTATPPPVAETVLVSATVELRVPVATPLAFVVPTGWVIVLPRASLAVTVIVLWLVPLEAVSGEVAATVDWAAATVPGLTTTLAVGVMATALIVADTVLVSAPVELR